MSDDQPDVGSVGEEATKLLGALSSWTGQDGLGEALGDLVGNVNEHVSTGGEDCRYCPVCQLIHAVRSTNPEIKEQLTTAASSLLQAAAGLLDTQVPKQDAPGVEKIDLSDPADGEPWDEDR